MQTLNDPLFLDAIARRDARFDGAFVYGPVTTGIYCRPSCPSRRPKPENIRIFAEPAAARTAGFRACLRCHPDEGRDAETDLLTAVCAELSDAAAQPMTLAALAARHGVSEKQLRRLFQRRLGVTPKAYGAALRRMRFDKALSAGQTVTTALYDAGYGSSRAAYDKGERMLAITPGAKARAGKGLVLAYGLAPTPYGALLVAGTDKGLATVRLGDDADGLEADFRQDFHAAALRRDESALADWLAALTAYLKGGPWPADLPVDVTGTAFQAKVWQALCALPPGQTVTYADIAKAIGAPGAVRAVGSACGANEAALVIPCHRVVRTDGGLGGYRWGVRRKEKLLAQERDDIA